MTKIYHNPRCSKSRAALELLIERGLEPEVILYLETPLTLTQLQQLVKKSNLRLIDLLRTNEAIYSELSLEQASEQERFQALVEHPILLNRPFVETDKGVRLARPLEAIEEIL